jgi:hypothetical protein
MGIDMSISCVECNERDDSSQHSETSESEGDLQLKESILRQLQLEQSQRQIQQSAAEIRPPAAEIREERSPHDIEKKTVEASQLDDLPSPPVADPLIVQLDQEKQSLVEEREKVQSATQLEPEGPSDGLEETERKILSPDLQEICATLLEELIVAVSEQLAPQQDHSSSLEHRDVDLILASVPSSPAPSVSSEPQKADDLPSASLALLLSSISQDSNDDLSPLPFPSLAFPPSGDDLSIASSSSRHSRSSTRSSASHSSSKRTVTCHRCQQPLPRHSFSALQLQKKIHRICKQCVSGDVYVL